MKIQSLFSWVKCWSPQNTAGVSREGGVALIAHIIEAYGGQDSNVRKFIMKPQNISKLLYRPFISLFIETFKKTAMG